MKNSEKPKIAVLCSGLDSKLRGYEAHQRSLFENLKNEKCDVVLFKRTGKRIKNSEVPLKTPSESSFISKIVSFFYEDPNQLQKAFFSVAFVIYTIIFKKEFDYLLIIEPGVARVIKRIRKLLLKNPVILYTHGIGNGPEYYFNLCDQVIEVNEPAFLKAKHYACKLESSPKLHCIPHFVDKIYENQSERDSTTINTIKNEFGILTKHVAVHVGLVCKNPKNVDYILQEIEQLPDEWSLLLVGEVKDKELLGIGNSKLGARFIHITLPRQEVWKAYVVSDVMVFASINEGFGMVIIESLSSGLPVLLPDIPLYRWITNSDENSLYELKTNRLSSALKDRVLDAGLVAKQKAFGKELVEKNYTWDSVRERYLSLLE